MIKKIMQGCAISIDATGTRLFFRPGTLTGGDLYHECNVSRGIGYYLEVLLALAPFSKTRLTSTLVGVTNCSDNQGPDPSVDSLIDCAIPVLQKFGIIADLELKVKRRGTAEFGGGEVTFTCPAVSSLKSINWRDPGFIKKIRGVAYSINLSHQMADVMVSSAKGMLLTLLPDVRIDKDVRSAKIPSTSSSTSTSTPQSGSGFGIVLTAISTTGCSYSAEAPSSSNILSKHNTSSSSSMLSSSTSNVSSALSPSDVGILAASRLLCEIKDGGCVPSFVQWLVLLLLPLTPSGDASFVKMGELSENAIQMMRLMREFMGIMFRVKEKEEEQIARHFTSEKNENEKEDDSVSSDDGDEAIEEDDEASQEESKRLHFTSVEISVMGRGFANLARHTS
ncbi:putative RNA terminal phosphate cyclase-like 1 [Monocercomonoides exilis]|uniref:putative RNA terminal phosphate cyclase-like 1 n=1 Tax=Monocercomonoides exilis TaxID=2049356 RepID=UPI00355A4681|nr:putative RNA terminal phosphate cyclase-like 1 [Monocercomonoides exilis]|eukprot:MONOS_2226.1-p1 / transcript=MONOS_2226.1 / gene=MONOS_2226 / organism=Monocercomonoides_exilis_PA203 / gene_product=RNA terminal phosphate cyclase-like 1 / transcript_product=RNA terminal phosphate cyclase-like 1 / location=Mono_scaffold00044:130641-132017(+) / protein_length=393 / sequence_SO=supercontig / SO=protein_coding / is_pseudo=false